MIDKQGNKKKKYLLDIFVGLFGSVIMFTAFFFNIGVTLPHF